MKPLPNGDRCKPAITLLILFAACSVTSGGNVKRDIQALTSAAAQGHLQQVQKLLAQQPQISHRKRRRLVASAAEVAGGGQDLAKQPGWLPLLADFYKDVGRLAEAVDYYQRALTLGPNDPHTNAGLATLLHQRGERDKAREHLDRALSTDPTNRRALEALRKLTEPPTLEPPTVGGEE